MRQLLMLLVLVLLSSGVQAVVIDGQWTTRTMYLQLNESGPRFFGTLPEGSIVEVAYATESYAYITNAGDCSIPLPVYEDNTVASLEEVLFIVRFDELNLLWGEFHYYASWEAGNPTVSVGLEEGYCEGSLDVTIECWAFRQGQVGAATVNLGQLKALYE